ncbi:lytic transglycosylase domain-containing protein [Dongia sp.]|uniref:lytic transglycosylase domain-containing protein n=1 Tax=Dongia sp. TaxID=1977262 RepID=UPI0035ADA6BD
MTHISLPFHPMNALRGFSGGSRIRAFGRFVQSRLLWLALLSVLVISALHRPGFADEAPLSAKDKKLFQQAFQAIEKDRWKEARRLADLAKDPLLAKVVQWLDLTRPGPGRSFDEMARFLKNNPDWPLRDTLTAQAERAMPAVYPTASVLAWFGERPPLTADGAIKLLGALRADRQFDRAKNVARVAWTTENFSKEQENTFILRFGDMITMADHVVRLDNLLWEDERDQAVRMLKRVDAGHAALASARMRLQDKKISPEAASGLVPLPLRDDPGLIYEMARAWRKQGKIDRALQLLDPPPAQVARPDLMWDELYRASRELLGNGDVSAAYRLAAAHNADTGDALVEGEWFAGWIALRYLDEPDVALKHFTNLYNGAKSIISKTRAAYWNGRAAEAKGDMAAATDWYRNAAKNLSVYYGQLAAARLTDPKHLVLDSGVRPDAAEKAAFAKREMTRVVLLLGKIGEADRVRPFIMTMTNRATKATDYVLLASLAKSVKRDDLAIAVAKEARQKGFELAEYLFPTIKLPPGNAPEPALVLAIIKQESAFDARISSPAGAKGLMQLMPSTARPLAKELGVKKLQEKKLTSDPAFNVRLGRLYLEKLIDRFGGSYIMAVAAYNAGPSRVRDWTILYGDPRSADTDAIDWVENIPFDETRNYVQRVMENLQIYRSRLSQNGAQIALEDDLNRPAIN